MRFNYMEIYTLLSLNKKAYCKSTSATSVADCYENPSDFDASEDELASDEPSLPMSFKNRRFASLTSRYNSSNGNTMRSVKIFIAMTITNLQKRGTASRNVLTALPSASSFFGVFLPSGRSGALGSPSSEPPSFDSSFESSAIRRIGIELCCME